MATHKVPQDVEAEDKLVGFLSLKQFIFTVLGLGFGYLTFFFFTKIHPLTALIWIPPAIICFVLGLYQRKDQPVEVYLASALRFYLKPHKRKWSLEGYEERVIITAPPKIEHHYTKNFNSEEATSRLSNLSRLMDSRGWATKLTSDWQNPQLATVAASERLVQPAQLQPAGIDPLAYVQPVDMMDEQSSVVAQDFQARLVQNENTTKQHAMATLQQARQSATTTVTQSGDDTGITPPKFQKYPAMHQKVVAPAAEKDAVTKPEKVEPKQETPKPAEKPAVHRSSKHKEHTSEDGTVEISLH